MKITKTMKNFRLSERTIAKLESLQKTLGVTLTEVVARAIELLHDAHKEVKKESSKEFYFDKYSDLSLEDGINHKG